MSIRISGICHITVIYTIIVTYICNVPIKSTAFPYEIKIFIIDRESHSLEKRTVIISSRITP